MAYNRKNLLEKIIEIQTITLEQEKIGLSKRKIYDKFVRQQHHISRGCYFSYLGTNAKRELKILQERELQQSKQLKLFTDGKDE